MRHALRWCATLLALVAAFAVAPDPLFVRLMGAKIPQDDDAPSVLGDGFVVTAWKSALLGIFAIIIAVCMDGGLVAFSRGVAGGSASAMSFVAPLAFVAFGGSD